MPRESIALLLTLSASNGLLLGGRSLGSSSTCLRGEPALAKLTPDQQQVGNAVQNVVLRGLSPRQKELLGAAESPGARAVIVLPDFDFDDDEDSKVLLVLLVWLLLTQR